MSIEAVSENAEANPVIASVLYQSGQAPLEVALDRLEAFRGKGLLWIGLHDPSTEFIRALCAQLDVSPRAIEEIIEPHRRPKIIEYDRLVQIVAVTIEVSGHKPVFGETQYLIGSDFLVTIRRGAMAGHRQLREHLESQPDMLARGSDYVASALLDLLVDRYVTAATQMESVVEKVEQRFLLHGFHAHDVRRLYRQRRDLLRMHTAIAPMVEICRRLANVDMKLIDADCRPYFGQVADRVARVTEFLGSLREALAFAFEAGLMIGQAQQTDIAKRLASWAAILAVPTAVAGIYGMNFKDMPELNWHYGYPVIMGATFAVCGILFWRFRKSGWL